MKKVLLLICTLLCVNVLMAQTRFWVDSLQYEVTSTTPSQVSVYYADSLITNANIPATVSYNGTDYSVTSIGEGAFARRWDLVSITLPNTITSIEYAAFYACRSLSSITLPNSLTSIGDLALHGCWSLSSITIPNSVTSIGNSAFNECRRVYSISIPNSVTSVGYSMLPERLTSIYVDMTSIPEYFAAYLELDTITFGENVVSIGVGAFKDCYFIAKVTCLSPTPPTFEDSTAFTDIHYATPLIVPCGSLEEYSSPTSLWSMFFNKIEEDCESNTGIESVEDTQFSFYPNPTNSNITFNAMIEKIEVIDLTGRCVLTFSNVREINIESLYAGVYYLRLTNKDKAIIRKVIKE